MSVRFIVAVLVAYVAISAAQDFHEIIPEALIEEMTPEPPKQAGAVSITRECFERTCSTSECRMARMPCKQEKMAPWAIFVSPETHESKLVNMDELVEEEHKKKPSGLVDIVQHKHELNPNMALPMPGIPAKASPKLEKAMKKQETLLKKITKLEKWEYKKDPLHKQTRKKWLELADSIKHLPPGPDKMKEQVLLLKLAKQLADKEKKEASGAKKLAKDESGEKKVAPDILKGFLKAISEGHAQKDELEAVNRHCIEKACISKLPNGHCGAAVVSC